MSDADVELEIIEAVFPAAPSNFRIFFAAVSEGGTLQYKDQSGENGPFDADFTQIARTSFATGHLNASSTQEGYVALLAQQAEGGALTYFRESRDADSGTRFAPPVDLGLPEGVSGVTDTALINGITGRQNVFVTASDAGNAIWWKYQNVNTVVEETVTVVPPGTETPIEITVPVEIPPSQPWGDWQQLDGSLVSLSPVQNADGRIILAGLDADAVPYLNFQSSDRPLLPEGWLGWQDISGGLTGFQELACGIGADALVHIFASIGSKIYLRVQEDVSSTRFSDWSLFASFADPVGSMALCVGPNSGLYLVAQVGSGADSPVYGAHQTGGADSDWSAPAIIAHVANDSTLMLQPNANTRLSLFALETATGAASYIDQQTRGTWSAVWTPLGSSLAQIGLTQDISANTD